MEEWKDLSGTGNSLAAMSDARAPVLLSNGNGLGSTPSVSFDGNENALTKDIDVNLPTGNTVERSVFMLVRYDSTGWGGFSWGTIGCLTVFGLGVTPGKGNIFVESYCTDDTEQAGVTGNLPASCPQEVPLLMRRGADIFWFFVFEQSNASQSQTTPLRFLLYAGTGTGWMTHSAISSNGQVQSTASVTTAPPSKAFASFTAAHVASS